MKILNASIVRFMLAWLVILQFMTATGAEPNFRTLVSFTSTNGPVLGAVPESRLLLGNDGYLYGTTISGGTNNLGTIFKISTNGDFSTSFQFTSSSGYEPQSGLMQAQDGMLYGTTGSGGANGLGTAFRLSTNDQFMVFAAFDPTNGFLASGLIQARDGNFYGTAWEGGTNGYGQFGTVFKLSTNGSLSALYCFGSKTNGDGIALDGQSPQAALVEARDGALYGTTTAGGSDGGFGTIFRITTDGTFSSLASFNGTNGANPAGALVEGIDGSLFGTASGGGIGFSGSPYSGNGTVFKVTKSGVLTVLHYFTGYPDDGAVPEFVGMVAGTDGDWYGTSFYGGGNGEGGVWRMTPQGQSSLVYSFSRRDYQTGTNTDGSAPWAGLTQASDGTLYGTAGFGGLYGFGTVFCLSSSEFSKPLIQTVSHTNTTTVLGWTPLPRRSYQLQGTSISGSPGWMNIGNTIVGTNLFATALDSTAFVSNRMYRLVLLP